MNYAIIIAAGSGKRTQSDIPKQFVTIYDKPIIIYTLEAFQKSKNIDHIIVVCLQGWEQMLQAYCKQYKIDKLLEIVVGGEFGQESIRNGLNSLEKTALPTDNIIIHDGIRPLVDDFVLTDIIEKAEIHGNAITSIPFNEQVFIKDDEYSTSRHIDRSTLKILQTPQCYKYYLLKEAYRKAFEKGIGVSPSSYTNTMMVELGHKLYFALGSDRNIKITNPSDFDLFRAMIDAGMVDKGKTK